MEGNENGGSNKRADDIYSQSLRAGNRTYFFDVKSTKSEDLYLTITESKRRFNNDNGKFFYEKHKLFLYPEDFESFTDFLEGTLSKIKELNGDKVITPRAEQEKHEDQTSVESKTDQSESKNESNFSDINFEDLG